MKTFRCYQLIFLLSIGQTTFAQATLPYSRSIQKAYENGSRNRTGAPGASYWQNTANYKIRVSFNPFSRELKGIVDIDYFNNSPDTLSRLVLKLYPNLYKSETIRNIAVSPADLGDGMRIDTIKANGDLIDDARKTIRGTNMFLSINRLLPRQQEHITINYAYTLNQGSFIRTGQIDTGAFLIAYFFPRVTVYDDIDGWNEYPYAGKEEFYNDYGNFDVDIEVPGDYQVWATGELVNINEVYTPKFVQRIIQADAVDSVTDVITEDDLKTGDITFNKPSNHWKFSARQVTDFAFAISNHYIWKASGVTVDTLTKRRTRVDAIYNPLHTSYRPVVSYARRTVELISRYLPGIPFPYPHQTIFDGLDAMEYPMMVNNLPFKEKREVIEFTAHEVFHAIFPFYVGTNETKFSFMDEGWATLAEFLLFPLIDSGTAVDYDLSPVNTSAGSDEDVPIMTPTPQLYGKARFADKDLKPALGYLYVKEMLGDRLFQKGLQSYIYDWQGKHPSPYDFFNTMNTATGVNLNWFWKNWFFEKNVPDLAIANVIHKKPYYTVIISSPGTEAVPIHLKIIYQDGTEQIISKDISIWSNHRKIAALTFKAKSPVKELVLGDDYDVDVNPANNHWPIPRGTQMSSK
jgi:hypothetical protein